VRQTIGRLAPIAIVALMQSMRPSLGDDAASFVEIARQGGAIITARCRSEGKEKIVCAPLEAWRGSKPQDAIVLSREFWDQSPVRGLEKRPGAKFLMVVGSKPGDIGACILPVLNGRLPQEFRRWYDRSRGPALSPGQLKADLLAPTEAPFLDLARHGVCADVRSRLFVIDQALVLWERVGNCPDNGYGTTLYGRTVDDVLCSLQDSIAGPMKSCPAPGYREMFEIIIQHIDQSDLGLGAGHDVQRLPL